MEQMPARMATSFDDDGVALPSSQNFQKTIGLSPVVVIVLIAHARVACLNKAMIESLCMERRQIEAAGVPNHSSASDNIARRNLVALVVTGHVHMNVKASQLLGF